VSELSRIGYGVGGAPRAIAGATALALLGCALLAATTAEAKTVKRSKLISTPDLSVPIVDGSERGTTLDVAKRIPKKAKIKSVEVRLRLDHNYVGDLEIEMATPRGLIKLASFAGGAGANYGVGAPSCDGTKTRFSDGAGTPIALGAAPFVGSFRPTERLGVLKGLTGTRLRKAFPWDLFVFDVDSLFGGQPSAGTLYCWQLRVRYTIRKPG
jgi:hypothetical protein